MKLRRTWGRVETIAREECGQEPTEEFWDAVYKAKGNLYIFRTWHIRNLRTFFKVVWETIDANAHHSRQ
jgi:hypothetical protein